MSKQISQVTPQESDSDSEFVDAKESWEETDQVTQTLNSLQLKSQIEPEEQKDIPKIVIKPDITPLKGTTITIKSPALIAPKSLPKPSLSRTNLPCTTFYSDPPKTVQHSPFKAEITKTRSFKTKNTSPFKSNIVSTNPTDKSSAFLTPASMDLFEKDLDSNPKSEPPVMGVLPAKPVTLPLKSDPIVTPKPRARVPPIGVIKTQKSAKDLLEFDGLCIQQELRAGAQSIWVARFSPDGGFFATGGEDKILRIWEIGDFNQQCIFLVFVYAK